MECLGTIVGVGFGWNDEVVLKYAEEIRTWPDGEAACEACAALAVEWTKTTRIPLGVIRQRYDELVRHKRLDHQPRYDELDGRTLTGQQAREIAAQGYLDEAKRRGVEPNWEHFDAIFGVICRPEAAR